MSSELEFLSRHVAKGKTEPARFPWPRRRARRHRHLRQLAALQRGARRRPGQGRHHQGRPGRRRIHQQPRPGAVHDPGAVRLRQDVGRDDRRAVAGRRAGVPHRRGDRLFRRRQGVDAEDPRRHRVPQRQDRDGRRRGRHARAPFRRKVEVRRARLHEGHREHQGQRQGSRPDAEGSRMPTCPTCSATTT